MRRGGVILLASLIALAGFVFFVFYGLTTEAFWRRAVFPRFFGPYWDTVIRWDRFEPDLFPPGIAFTNLELVEPNLGGPPLLRIKSLRARATYGSSSSRIQLTSFEAQGVDVNLVMYSQEETNLSRVVTRLFEGKNPPSHRRSIPQDGGFLPSIVLKEFTVPDFTMRIVDRRQPEMIEYVYTADEPVQVKFNRYDTVTGIGRLDEFTRILSSGNVAVTRGGLRAAGAGTVTADFPALHSFPSATGFVTAALTPLSGSGERIDLKMELPLNRTPVRVSATPLRKVELSVHGAGKGEPVLRITNADLDPLSGALSGDVLVKGTLGLVGTSLGAYLSPESVKRVLKTLAEHGLEAEKLAESRDVELDWTLHVEGSGLAQYAIVDQTERLPAEIKVTGKTTAVGVAVNIPELLTGTIDSTMIPEPLRKELRSRVDAEWEFTADEKGRRGGLIADVKVRPASRTDDTIIYTLHLADATDGGKPVEFNPYRFGRLSDVLAESREEIKVPENLLFQFYEPIIEQAARVARVSERAMDELEVKRAQLSQEVVIRDTESLREFLSPVLAKSLGAASGSLKTTLTHIGHGQPADWTGSFQVDEVQLEGIPDRLRLLGSGRLVRDGTTLTASDFELGIVRLAADGSQPLELSLGLPRTTKEGGLGPATPTSIDLATGEGHFALRVNTIRRELMEVILRIQSFGLSKQLASPLYQRMLDVLGFRPNDPSALGEADLYLTGDIGKSIRLASQVSVRNIPTSNFLIAPEGHEATSERFDALFSQMLSLDRATSLIRMEEFELGLSASGTKTPMASLRMEPDAETRIDYAALQEFANEEASLFVAAPSTRPSSFKEMVSGVFGRIERIRSATRGGGGSIVFSLPGIELSDWRGTLEAAGVPVAGGRLSMELRAALTAGDSAAGQTARGFLDVSDLQLLGTESPIPKMHADLQIDSDGSRVYVKEFSTELNLDANYPPTSLSFTGSAEVESFASDWVLSIGGVNGSIFKVLAQMENSGVGIAANILRYLPGGQLGEMANGNAAIDLSFHGSSDAAGREVTILARQQGEEIVLFPAVLRPLSFWTNQSMRYFTDGGFRIDGIEGRMEERGLASPLLELSMDKPITFGGEGSGESGYSTIVVRAHKDFGEIAERLREFRFPLFERALTGGDLSGEMAIRIPLSPTSREEGMPAITTIRAVLKQFTLEGFPKSYDAEFNGELVNRGDDVTIERAVFATSLDGEPAGRVEFSSHFQVAAQRLRTMVELIDFNQLLLEALPEDYRRWVGNRDSRLDLRGDFDADFAKRAGRASITAAVRRFGLPSITLPGGETYSHPPLDLDFAFTSEYDAPTSSILLQDFSVRVAKAVTGAGRARLERISDEAPTYLAVSPLAPIRYDLGQDRISSDNAEGAGLEARLGPIPLAEYGVMFRELFGVPLVDGELVGKGMFVTSGANALRLDNASLRLGLERGLWRGRDGDLTPLEADLDTAGSSRGDTMRLDDFLLAVRYPFGGTQHEDRLGLRGFVQHRGGKRRFQVDVSSDSLVLDRLLGFAGDVQEFRSRVAASSESSPPLESRERAISSKEVMLRFPSDLEGIVNGQFRNLSYKQVGIPALRMKADFADQVVRLTELRSRLDEGELTLSGQLDFAPVVPSWTLKLNIDEMEARPWVNSFAAPEYYGNVSGRLDARVEVSGVGVSPRDLAGSLEGRTRASIRDGRIETRRYSLVLGEESDLSLDADVTVRGNRALFKLSTPWNPSRDLLMQGSVRRLFDEEGRAPDLHALLQFTRMTVVGPRGRTMDYKGGEVPFRQAVAGIVVELEGPLRSDHRPGTKLRSVNY